MRQSYLKGIASFMAALIVSLPIYSSFVLGVLNNGYIYGTKDSIRGHYRKNEDVYINITAWISGDNEINASQVHLYDSKGPSFNSCIDRGDGSFYCIYKMNSNSIKQNPYQLRVALYNDKGVFDSLFILDGAFDEIAPDIRSFNIVPSIIGSGNLNFQYGVYDHSYSNTDSDRCSGINRIELSHNKVFETVIEPLPNQCGKADSITVPLSKINASEGTVEIFLTAYDNFEQKSSKSSQFIYDPDPPFVDKGSLEIRDMNGESIDHIGDKSINGIISFIVVSDDLDVNNVYGDISDINIGHIPSYNKKQASCAPFEEGFKCSFTNVEIKLDKSTTVNVKVDAYDIAGNLAPDVLSKDIIYDNIGPSVRAIRTDKADNYVGGTTRFIVELDEDGAGIDKNDIKLDLSNIKSGLSNKAADECIESNGVWGCYWNNVKCDKGDGETTVRVLESSSDKLGNKVSGTLSASVVIDKTAPVVMSSSVIGSGVGVEGLKGFIKTGDVLEAKLKIKEKGNIRAYADFSPFVTTKGNISGSCIKEGEDTWSCEWSTSPKTIDVPGHRIGNVNFNIVDIVGNSVEHKKQIEVMEYEGAVDVSYWTSKVKCSPKLVDRQVTDLVNTRVYCSVTLNPITPDQETLSIELDPCTDSYNGSLGYIENVELVNAVRGSTEPYLSIDLIKGEMTIDRLSLRCPLKIISRVGTKINKEPEIEPVKVDINFYNMPLGEYGKGIEGKIKDAKDDAFGGLWKIIGTLKKLLGYAKLLCNVLHMIYRIKLIYQAITSSLTLAHITSIGTPLQGVLGPIKTQACIGDNLAGKYAKASYGFSEEPGALDKFCKFVNCQMSPQAPGDDKGGDGKEGSWFKEIENSLGSWTYQGNQLLAKAPTSSKLQAFPFSLMAPGASGTIEEVTGKQPYQYMNARDNLLVAIVLGCIPGIINGLEKYRQIQCLYADCLEQNAVNNVPVKICEDQKAYATCKYIFGEIFAILPWTALFDYYMGMIRSALSDPLSAIGFGISFWCEPECEPSPEGSKRWVYTGWCHAVAFFSVAGEVISEVKGIIDDYKQIKGDYCKRLKED